MDDNSTPQQTQNPNDAFSADYTQADQVQATPMAENIQMADTMAEVEVVEQQPLAQVDETGAPEPSAEDTPTAVTSADPTEPADSTQAEASTPPIDDTPATDAAVESSGNDTPDSTDLESLGIDNDGEQMSADGSFGLMGPDL